MIGMAEGKFLAVRCGKIGLLFRIACNAGEIALPKNIGLIDVWESRLQVHFPKEGFVAGVRAEGGKARIIN
jgi:hypothetical protein